MVGVMVVAFGVMYARADVPAGEVLRGFTVPSLPKKDLPVVGVMRGGEGKGEHMQRQRRQLQARILLALWEGAEASWSSRESGAGWGQGGRV